MSPSNINSFVGDLVQMAQAMEQLPKVEAERDELKINLDRALDTVQSRELRIIDLNATIAELNNKVRSLEVERDDASFRVMEMEDKTNTVEQLADSAKAMLEKITSLIVPPKPEPVLEPQGSSEPNPTIHGTVASTSSPDQISASNTATQSQNVSTSTTTLEGQSESPSTASTGQMETAAPWTPAPNTDAGLTTKETSSVDPGPALGPYFGKRYDAQPAYINFNDWLVGGGTEADYYWRPDRESGSTF